MRAVDIVVPTIGRPSLAALLDALAAQSVAPEGTVLVVDDRRDRSSPLPRATAGSGLDVRVVDGSAAGPAAARNTGWRQARTRWVAFVDDDVVPDRHWWTALQDDLDAADREPDVVGVQGRVRVPLPAARRPTDWERNVAGLAGARWATADMAYRLDALAAVGGFDESFPRAYREDADLALRLLDAGGRLTVGTRSVSHPVRPAPWHVSLRLQAGNADDAVMARRHGPRWRDRAGAPRGALRGHVAVTAALAAGLASAAHGDRRAASVAFGAWLAGTVRFASSRIAPGPRTVREVAAMAATSLAVPPAAVAWRLVGAWRARRVVATAKPRVGAVLFDRDGTLIVDEPYNGDPDKVVPVGGALEAVERLRRAGIRLGVISNQSGVARGTLDLGQVAAVNDRVETLLGPFDVVAVCPHGPEDGCGCRKPAPGLVERAARALGVAPEACVVVGDIGSDVGAALAAGARAVLVPTPVTRADEVVAALSMPATSVAVAADLAAASTHILERWS